MVSNNYLRIDFQKISPVAYVKLNRPLKLNAIDSFMLQELSQVLDLVELDPEVKCLVISGEGGKAFSAGADLNELQKLTANSVRDFSLNGQQVFSKIENMSKPVLAAINGYALGGGLELALACDFRIATVISQFGFPEKKLGFIPGWGGTQRLPLIVGELKSTDMIASGNNIGAKEALKIGLVTNVVSLDDFAQETESFAWKLCEYPSVEFNKLQKIHSKFSPEGFKTETDSFVRLFLLPETKSKLSELLSRRNKK